MSYAAIEASVQDAVRVEIYTFELTGRDTYRLTDFDQDVTFDGQTYTATTLSRGPVPLVPLGKVRDVAVSIDLHHPLAVDLRLHGIPPRDALVTIRAFFLGDSESRLVWKGYIAGSSTENEFTRFRVPNRLEEAFDCQLPAVVAQRTCPHLLYGAGCDVDPVAGGFIVSTTAASIGTSGAALVVASMGGKPDNWARYGKLVRTLDGEERSIISQVGTAIGIDVPFVFLDPGDALDVYAGCDLTIDGLHGCVQKFANGINFGGDPQFPSNNPSAPTGLGVTAQI